MGEVEQLRAEIERLSKELDETRATTQQYLQNVAHQLTAPLGAIKWSIEALKDDRVPIQRKQVLLRSIYSQATILVHLIKNFALMSSLEADHELGQFREQPEPVEMVRPAINLANDFQPQASEVGMKIEVDVDSFRKGFGERCLKIEKNLVAQAISNIIENAVKYGNGDTVIRVSGRSTNDMVGLAVESVGLPITDEEKAQLLARGFRGDAARQKVAAGTGIGLYLASRVMGFHKGTIRVETQGKRTAFVLMFPKTRLAKT